ncbi:hypothetical protein BC831DRAFT_476918 [Entophlyctis helioformis]|nr:hypothetical protein BC831DRAFT_476918 [Entophlyctis helioformis]
MPIVVKHTDVETSQTLEEVFVTVPLRGVHASKADVYSSAVYIKANFPPYFFELDLADEIDTLTSVATVGGGVVTFKLVKAVPRMWESIRYTGAKSPKDLHQRRREAEAVELERAKQRKAAALLTKREEERTQVQRQIDVERAKRSRIEALKDAEARAASEQISGWARETLAHERRVNGGRPTVSGNGPSASAVSAAAVAVAAESVSVASGVAGSKDVEKKSDIFGDEDVVAASGDDLDGCGDGSDGDDDIDMEAIRAKVRAQLKIRTRPSPRACQDIGVSFTARGSIPTHTARETEDDKWRLRIRLMEELHRVKQAAESAGKSATEDETKPDEQNPAFLKDKGAQFYQMGNMQAAIHAYTSAINLDPINASLYANRAACHLSLKSADDCIADCTTTLSLLSKEEDMLKSEMMELASMGMVDSRRLMRIKILARRGAAYVLKSERGDSAMDDGDAAMKAALADFRDAIKMDPMNIELRTDAEAVASRLGVEVEVSGRA